MIVSSRGAVREAGLKLSQNTNMSEPQPTSAYFKVIASTTLRTLAHIAGDAALTISLLGALSLMVAVTTFDLLPNSTIDNYLILLSGALAGLVSGILKEQRVASSMTPGGTSVLPLDKQARAASLLGPSQTS